MPSTKATHFARTLGAVALLALCLIAAAAQTAPARAPVCHTAAQKRKAGCVKAAYTRCKARAKARRTSTARCKAPKKASTKKPASPATGINGLPYPRCADGSEPDFNGNGDVACKTGRPICPPGDEAASDQASHIYCQVAVPEERPGTDPNGTPPGTCPDGFAPWYNADHVASCNDGSAPIVRR